MSSYDATHQAATLPTATRRNERYTTAHLNVIKDCVDGGVPARIIAEALHRSLYGVRAAVRTINTPRVPVYLKQADLPFDHGFTTLAEMGF